MYCCSSGACYHSVSGAWQLLKCHLILFCTDLSCRYCSRSIDTNKECTRLVADNWLILTLRNGQAGEKLLLIAHQLRLLWASMLHERLQRVGGSAAGRSVDADTATTGAATGAAVVNRASDGGDGNDDGMDGSPGGAVGSQALQAAAPSVIPRKALAKLPAFARQIYGLRSLSTTRMRLHLCSRSPLF